MTDQQKSETSSRYDQAREAFSDLGIEDRILFLVRESASTVMLAAQAVVETMQTECENIFGAEKNSSERAEPQGENGAA